ncbi:substrate-binding domain-containing protein [Sneathiella glossodoripedis]|uniref:substrate-binding domain-containing protein n=1 Tax=Sneathiella glossodoripedis TaxID=418853 RepID=UPI000A05DFA3
MFHRRGKSISLTETGNTLFNLTGRYFQIESEAEFLLKSTLNNERGVFRLAANQAAWLFASASVFKKKFPAIELKTCLRHSERLERELIDYRHDLVIISNKVDDETIDCQLMQQEPFTLTINKEHPLSQYESVILPDFKDLKLYLLPEHQYTNGNLNNWLKSNDHRHIFYCGDKEFVVEAIAHAEAVSFLTQSMVKKDPRLRSVQISDFPFEHRTYIAFQRKTMAKRFITKMIEDFPRISETMG